MTLKKLWQRTNLLPLPPCYLYDSISFTKDYYKWYVFVIFSKHSLAFHVEWIWCSVNQKLFHIHPSIELKEHSSFSTFHTDDWIVNRILVISHYLSHIFTFLPHFFFCNRMAVSESGLIHYNNYKHHKHGHSGIAYMAVSESGLFHSNYYTHPNMAAQALLLWLCHKVVSPIITITHISQTWPLRHCLYGNT